MNIDFNRVDMKSTNSFINITNSSKTANYTTAYTQSGNKVAEYTKDSLNNKAYKQDSKLMNNIASNAELESMSLDAKRDYMAVMSNCMSDEDFSKMQKEGFNPGSTDFDDAVTIVDHIKAAVMKGGTNVVGYTDTISDDALVEITGSKTYAKELSTQFTSKDIPLSESNVNEVREAYEELSSIGEINDAAIKFMVENNLVPNVDNLYTASFSSGKAELVQGQGYYSVDNLSGYYAKKPDNIDIEALMPQITKIIEESGLSLNEESIEASEWLIDKGLPLTKDNLDKYLQITNINLPMDYAEFVDIATNAISDGIRVKRADLSMKDSLREQATNLFNEVQNDGTVRGRRVLEEVRLSMTVEANLKLLRSGYAIDTAPMEELVNNLKEIEKEYAINLTGDEDEIEAVRKKNIFEDTVDLTNIIRRAPISIAFEYEKTDTLSITADKSNTLRITYEKMESSYEALMTAPRADMGDSIQKAFRNADELLKELDLPVTEENSRAVRILGYNSMEINEDNIQAVKEKDSLLTDTISKLTPGRVLHMIRSNINPINMTIEELNDYLSNQDTTKEDLVSYSRFLYGLEQNNSINDEERSAYIGIYRLIHQIEKGDFGAIGAIQDTGALYTLNNMLSAIRSKKHRNLDYRVDESFGGVDIVDRGIESITSQIARGFVADTSDIKKVLEEAQNREAQEAYDHNEYEKIRSAFEVETKVLEQLSNMQVSVTADNILNMQQLMNTPSSVFKRLRDLGYKKPADLKLDSKDEMQTSFGEYAEDVKDYIEDNAFDYDQNTSEESSILHSSMDIRQMADLYGYMDFLVNQAKEENYEIPVEINGELTSINLKVIHKGENESVCISFESERYGTLAAQFTATDNGLSGYVGCSNKEGLSELRARENNIRSELEKESIRLNEINYLETEVNLSEFNNNVIRDRNKDMDVISTDKLYKVAKVFIGSVAD